MTSRVAPLNVAVVGLGVGEQHARAFASDPRCRVRWLLDLDASKAERLAGNLGQGEVAESYEAILADTNVQIVSIATYDHLHYDAVAKAFDAGKHVFVEKPLCRTAAEVADLRRRWNATGRPHLQANLVLRRAPLYRWLQRAIAQGDLGMIYAFDGDYLYGRLEKITEGWRKDVPDYSVMEGGGVHIIDLMLMLLNEAPESVTVMGTNRATRGTDFKYDDLMAATFTFPSGILGRVTANFACVHPHHHVIRLFGTKGTFIYDDQGPRLFLKRGDGERATSLSHAPLPAGKGVLIPDFVTAIIDGIDSGPAAEREFALAAVCAAADLAHATNESQPTRMHP